jgi:hypothetical protein
MADPVKIVRFWAPVIEPPKFVALAPLLRVTSEESEITAELIVIEPLPVELILSLKVVVSTSLSIINDVGKLASDVTSSSNV